jgi:hypothetical protein
MIIKYNDYKELMINDCIIFCINVYNVQNYTKYNTIICTF